MYTENDDPGKRRVVAGIATLAVHGGLAAILVWGLRVGEMNQPENAGKVLTVALDEPPPPSPPPPPAPAPISSVEPMAAGPQGKTGEAIPREAPEAALPIAVAPAAPTAESGRDTEAGAGATGNGTGAGGAGSGQGGGGTGSPAQRITGALRDSDYPRGAEEAGLAGTVGISFRVRTDGAVDRCAVTRSSGAAVLDDLTCRLFTQRYRFRPATDAAGQPIETILQTSFTWGTRRRR